MATVTLKGHPTRLAGHFPDVGEKAKDFILADLHLNNKSLKDFTRKKLLLIVPSLETPVCATCSQKFHQKLVNRSDLDLLIISADLPFTQKKYAVESNKNIYFLSMMRSKNFGKDYGVLIEEGPLEGICTRAVLLLDASSTVLYAELVSEITEEPNYDKVFALL